MNCSRQVIVGCLLLTFMQGMRLIVQSYFPHYVLVNNGVFFGLFTHPLVVILTIVLGILILVRLAQSHPSGIGHFWGITLVITGAVSNVLDRFFVGGVVDYFPLFGWSTFNLADLVILGGVGLILWEEHSLRGK